MNPFKQLVHCQEGRLEETDAFTEEFSRSPAVRPIGEETADIMFTTMEAWAEKFDTNRCGDTGISKSTSLFCMYQLYHLTMEPSLGPESSGPVM